MIHLTYDVDRHAIKASSKHGSIWIYDTESPRAIEVVNGLRDVRICVSHDGFSVEYSDQAWKDLTEIAGVPDGDYWLDCIVDLIDVRVRNQRVYTDRETDGEEVCLGNVGTHVEFRHLSPREC